MAAMTKLGEVWFPQDLAFQDMASIHPTPENEKAEALQAVLDLAYPKPSSSFGRLDNPPRISQIDPATGKEEEAATIYPAKGIKVFEDGQVESTKTKRKRRTKAEMEIAKISTMPAKQPRKASKPFNYDAASDVATAKEVDRLAKNQPTREECIRKAVEEAIKPTWSKAVPSWDGFKHFVVNIDRPDGTTLSGKGDLWKNALKAAGIQFSKLEIGSQGMANRQLDIMLM